MKKGIFLLVILMIWGYGDIIPAQENPQPFIVSPFIGDKLDRIEEDYFQIFPAFTDFREAVFYINPDSSLNVKIRAGVKNILTDTTIRYNNSLSYLRDRINRRILTDISQSKVEELKLRTSRDSVYDGIVYSYENRQIRFIKNGFTRLKEGNNQDNYLQTLNYFEVNTITVTKTDASFTSSLSALCGLAGGVTAAFFAPHSTGWLSFFGNTIHILEYFLAGGVVGIVTGYLIGSSIKCPVEYDTSDPEAETVLYGNTLLTK